MVASPPQKGEKRGRRPDVGLRRAVGKGTDPAHGNNLRDRGNPASIMWGGTGRTTGR
jgi:hypothetical protein